jgi:hypothetical protein
MRLASSTVIMMIKLVGYDCINNEISCLLLEHEPCAVPEEVKLSLIPKI